MEQLMTADTEITEKHGQSSGNPEEDEEEL